MNQTDQTHTGTSAIAPSHDAHSPVGPQTRTGFNTRTRAKTRTGSLTMGLLIILVGAGLMAYPKLTDLHYLWAQWRLKVAAAAQSLSGGTGADERSLGGAILPDGTVALIVIPSIGLEAYVVEGTGGSALARGPGHYPHTPLPGEAGNAVIAGHRTMYGHPFHDLDRLQPGDRILTITSNRSATYRVTETIVVGPSAVEVTAQNHRDLLTLTTCHPKGSAAKRLVVVAELHD